MSSKWLRSLFSSDLSIDFGTHNTLVYAKARGIVCSERSIVAVDGNLKVIGAGNEVLELLQRSKDNVTVIRPLKNGTITRLDLAEKLIRYFILKAHNGKTWVSPRVVIGVHHEMTQVGRHALESCVYAAGASEVYLMDEAIAAAHGVGVSMSEPYATMIVDIGGGTTDINVMSMGGSVFSLTSGVAGLKMDDSIIKYVKQKYNLLLGKRVAEKIKIEIGSAFPFDEPKSMTVQGRQLLEGDLTSITISDEEVREALSDDITSIIIAIHQTLNQILPDLSADIWESGLILTGGGAQLTNLDRRLMIETGLSVTIAEDPFASIVLGLGKTLLDFDLHKSMKFSKPLWET